MPEPSVLNDEPENEEIPDITDETIETVTEESGETEAETDEENTTE